MNVVRDMNTINENLNKALESERAKSLHLEAEVLQLRQKLVTSAPISKAEPEGVVVTSFVPRFNSIVAQHDSEIGSKNKWRNIMSRFRVISEQ